MYATEHHTSLTLQLHSCLHTGNKSETSCATIMSGEPEYHLYYFNARGLAEPIRYILSYSGASWKDHREPIVAIPATVPAEIKQRSLFGQVPLLEFGDERLTQSQAITRYLARKFNLVGKDDLEAAHCDEVVDGVRDMNGLWTPAFYEKDEGKKAEIKASALQRTKERFLPVFNSLVEKNGGHVVGSSLTWADIYVAHFLDNIQIAQEVDLVGEYPALQALITTVLSTPGIKEYIASRPETKF